MSRPSDDQASLALPAGYGELLEQVKTQVRTARVQAARVVNVELIGLYWRIGRLIRNRQQHEGWGSRVIDRLAADLRAEFPGMRGFSPRNLSYMRRFAQAYDDKEILQQAVAQLPWGHLTVLLDRVIDPQARDWYAAQSVQHGWSRAVLSTQLTSDRYQRAGAALTNFSVALPEGESDLARELVTDPYALDFLGLDPDYSERQLEDALVAQLTTFLAELGAGFAFVGRQYRLPVGDREFFVDLLFFHLGLRCYVVFELKVGPAEPEHLGKLHFYVNAVDELLRSSEHEDRPTIGILLAADRDDVIVEYALRGYDTPMAVSTYTTHRALPADVRDALPSADDLGDLVRAAEQWRPRRPAIGVTSGAQSATLTWRDGTGQMHTTTVDLDLAQQLLDQQQQPEA